MVSAAMPMPKPGLFGMLGTGLKNVGSKFAPQFSIAKGAVGAFGGSIAQGAAAGAGFAGTQLVAKPLTGALSWVLNWLPENVAGMIMWGSVLLFFMDWRYFGFDIAAASYTHLLFAGIFFISLGIVQKFLNLGIAATAVGMLMALVGFLNAGSQMERMYGAIAFVAVFYFYWRWTDRIKDGDGGSFFRYVPIVAFIDVYGMPVFRDFLVSFADKFGPASFAVGFFFNRLLFPIWIYFSAATLVNSTRVAKRIFVTLVLFYFIAALPTLTTAYNAKVSSLTPEETQIATDVWDRFTTNVQRILSGEFLQGPVTNLQNQAEIAFGFGEPEEEPKNGLQLLADRTMPKTFDYSLHSAPEPSVVMSVPVPLPQDLNNGAIAVVNIACNDKVQASASQTITAPLPPPTLARPLFITNGRPRTAKCELEGLTKGSHTAEIKVSYKFHSNANFFTTFMRMDVLSELVGEGLDPAVVKKLPPANAKYYNGPVAVTWGPVELINSPSSVDIDPAKDPAEPNANLVLFVAKSPTWEGESEIGGITELTLTVPEGIELMTDDEKRCSFEKVDNKPNVYRVKKSVILADLTKSSDDFANLRLVGQSVQFSCKMKVKPSVLGGAEWAGAEFKASLDYLFTSKMTVSFGVTGDPSPTLQQLEDKCLKTFGTWLPAKSTCDCGGTDEWKGWPDGCKPVATKATTP